MARWDPIRGLWIVDQEAEKRQKDMDNFLGEMDEMEKAHHRWVTCQPVVNGNQQDGSHAPSVDPDNLQ